MKTSNVDDLIENYYSLSIVSLLIQMGAFDLLVKGVDSEELSIKVNIDSKTLESILCYLEISSSLINKSKNKYKWCNEIITSSKASFRLIKYLGAYPLFNYSFPNRNPLKVDSFVSQEELLALSFKQISGGKLQWVCDALDEFHFSTIAEIGCGMAPVLRTLIDRNKQFTGFAVDSNSFVIEILHKLNKYNFSNNSVTLLNENLNDICQGNTKIPQNIEVIILRGVLNSFFSKGANKVIEILSKLNSYFERPTIFVSDYYSQLNQLSILNPAKSTLAQDLAQVISGQGVPPSNPHTWNEIYNDSGFSLKNRFLNSDIKGIDQFLDILEPK